MFGIGMTELLVIFVVGLLVLGPKRLPEMARSLGRSLAEFRRASNDLRRSIMEADQPTPTPPPPRGPADEVAAAAMPPIAGGPVAPKAPAEEKPGGPSA